MTMTAASKPRDGGRGGRWAAVLAASLDDVVVDDPPDTSSNSKGRGVSYKAAAAPIIATDGVRRTGEAGGGEDMDGGAAERGQSLLRRRRGRGQVPASSSAAWARVVASLTAARARARARARLRASSSVVGAA